MARKHGAKACARKRRDRGRTSAAPLVRPHYLRTYDDDLDGALALVVRDVVATNALPTADAQALVNYYAEMHLRDLAPYTEAGGVTALWVAKAVQEDLIEGHGAQPRLVTWPAWPNHANHPLWLSTPGAWSDPSNADLADTAWTCPTTHEQIAELGKL